MAIIEQLKEPNFKVTKSDKIIINYIKNNLEEFSFKSISEIAKEINIGEATITRFTKKMGFKGIQDFKVNLTKEASINKEQNIIDSNITMDEPIIETAKKLLNSNINMLQSTVGILNSDSINKVVSLIMKARKVYFIGIGYSGIIAEDSNYKFMRIGINSTSINSSHTMIMMASIMSERDLIIAISHSGETQEIIETINLAKQNRAKVIVITGSEKCKLQKLSDVALYYVTKETKLETGAVSSKLAQMFLVDIIYTQMVKEKFNQYMDMKIRTTEAIKVFNNRI